MLVQNFTHTQRNHSISSEEKVKKKDNQSQFVLFVNVRLFEINFELQKCTYYRTEGVHLHQSRVYRAILFLSFSSTSGPSTLTYRTRFLGTCRKHFGVRKHKPTQCQVPSVRVHSIQLRGRIEPRVALLLFFLLPPPLLPFFIKFVEGLLSMMRKQLFSAPKILLIVTVITVLGTSFYSILKFT